MFSRGVSMGWAADKNAMVKSVIGDSYKNYRGTTMYINRDGWTYRCYTKDDKMVYEFKKPHELKVSKGQVVSFSVRSSAGYAQYRLDWAVIELFKKDNESGPDTHDPELVEIIHKDGNPLNCCIDNLSWKHIDHPEGLEHFGDCRISASGEFGKIEKDEGGVPYFESHLKGMAKRKIDGKRYHYFKTLGRSYCVDEMVLITFGGFSSSKLYKSNIIHLDGDPLNCALSNLKVEEKTS